MDVGSFIGWTFPSSGLLLVATSFQGYAYLEWQMYTYQIVRDYVVAGHSLVVPTLCLRDRILDLTTAVCSERGRPAETHLRLLSSCILPQEKPVSLLAVRIRTGRRHQIRVHLQSVAHLRLTIDTVSARYFCLKRHGQSIRAWTSDVPSTPRFQMRLHDLQSHSRSSRCFLGDGKDLLAVTTVFVCSRLTEL